MEADMKTCIKCNEEKSFAQFYKTKYTYHKDGYDYYCKYCRNGSSIKSQNIGKRKQQCSIDDCNNLHYAKTWCRMHYGRWIRKGSTESVTNKRDNDRIYYYKGVAYRKTREIELFSRYKITMDEFNIMAKNGCQICGDKPERRNLAIDHDHNCCSTEITCGKCVRGVVCHRCNVSIGVYERGLMRKDNPLLDKIIKYVEFNRG